MKVTAEEIMQMEAQQEKEAQLDLGGDGEDQDADWKLAEGDWQGGWGKWISILIKSFKVIVFE